MCQNIVCYSMSMGNLREGFEVLQKGRAVTLEFTIDSVSPEVLGIMFGQPPPEPTFGLEVTTPIKRTFWQWITRQPRQTRTVYIPNARLTR